MSALAWSQLTIGGALAGALAYGAATLVVEVAAASAAAVILTSAPSRGTGLAARGRRRIDDWMGGRASVDVAWYPAVAVLGGSAVTVWVRHLGQVDRSRKQLLGFGWIVASGLAVFGALQGALVGLGVSMTHPALVIGVLAGLIALPPLHRRLRRANAGTSRVLATLPSCVRPDGLDPATSPRP